MGYIADHDTNDPGSFLDPQKGNGRKEKKKKEKKKGQKREGEKKKGKEGENMKEDAIAKARIKSNERKEIKQELRTELAFL